MSTKKKDDAAQQPVKGKDDAAQQPVKEKDDAAQQPVKGKEPKYVVACSSLSSGGVVRSLPEGSELTAATVKRLREMEIVSDKDGKKVKLFDYLVGKKSIVTEAAYQESLKTATSE